MAEVVSIVRDGAHGRNVAALRSSSQGTSMAVHRVEMGTDTWVDLKERLKVRDKRDIHTYSVDGVATDGQTYRLNVVKHQIASAAVRVVAWKLDGVKSFPSEKAAFKERVAAIEDLDEELFDALNLKIREFESERDRQEEEEKNATADGVTA